MKQLDIIKIFNRIARTYPESECKGINGFGTLHDGSILSSNIGKTIDDYELGTFWSRCWEEEGKNIDEICLEYNALLIETKTGSVTNLMNTKKRCVDFIVMMVGKYDCDDCKCQRTKDQVKQDTYNTLIDVLGEFMKYRQYRCIETVDGEVIEYYAWLTPKEVEWMEENCPEVTCCKVKGSIQGSIKNFKDIKINEWEEVRKIGNWAEITICLCDTEQVEFNYTKTDYKQSGVTQCESC